MIVKVQVSIESNVPGGPHVLVYDEKRTFEYQAPAPKSILSLMDGRPKAFFHAQIRPDKQLELLEEAPWQTW